MTASMNLQQRGLARPGAPAGGGANSVTISKMDFDYVADLVRRSAAIELGPEKQYLVEQRLSAVARKEDAATIGELLLRSRRDNTGRTAKLVIDAMTTNETSFFRDPMVYEFLRSEIFPELIDRNRATRRLRIWCAATSSGQEPYSMLMVLREHFPEIMATWQVRLLATDISPTMIDRTRKSLYSRIEVNRGLPASYLVKYFERAGLDWKVKDDIRRLVDTREVNLAAPLPLNEQFDLVMLRNVLIYFSVETKRGVLDRIKRVLAPGGSLFLGATESTMHVDDSWVRRTYGNVSCYQPERMSPEEAR